MFNSNFNSFNSDMIKTFSFMLVSNNADFTKFESLQSLLCTDFYSFKKCLTVLIEYIIEDIIQAIGKLL